jgi:formate dehydrogenase major subunit
MHPEGLGRLFVPTGLKDGPLPTHYEPLESPVSNMLYPDRATNPAANTMERDDNRYADSPDARYPYVLSTYRLTEHHTAGGMSRYVSHLAELQPELFCEISNELAAELNIDHGSFVTVATPRGAINARAMVTARIAPLRIAGQTIHQVCIPYHWGYKGLVKGDVANDLIALSEEPNVRIMETKALLCNVQPATMVNGNPERKLEVHSETTERNHA